jgi:hypothetical protein
VPLSAAHGVDREAMGDRQQPCSGIAHPLELVTVAGQPDEGLLDDIRGVLRRSGAPQCKSVDLARS